MWMDIGQLCKKKSAGSTERSAGICCIYGCQKWIPDKIPHRNGYPKKISTFFFVEKKIFFENEQKYFSKNFFVQISFSKKKKNRRKKKS